MAQAQDLRQTLTSMAGRSGSVLSAYLSVNADIPENQGRAYLVRLRDAMHDEGAPEGLQRRVREYTGEETHPEARTLAIFADEDDLFEVYQLQVDVPESFRWGDPYVAPLTLVLDEYEPYGAVVLDETIAALQEENRLYHLAALWELEAEIRWCDNDQLAIREIIGEECPFCGRKTRLRPLTDVLVDLATARGARLDFMLGENENTDTLRNEFGGIAGLTRF
jgi:hypothetical protein